MGGGGRAGAGRCGMGARAGVMALLDCCSLSGERVPGGFAPGRRADGGCRRRKTMEATGGCRREAQRRKTATEGGAGSSAAGQGGAPPASDGRRRQVRRTLAHPGGLRGGDEVTRVLVRTGGTREIQPLVLSLLSLKEASKTSLVSRNWRKLWTRYPNLCFDGSKDGSTDMDSVKIESSKFIETKATLTFHKTWLEEDNNKVLGHVFHGIPSVSAVKVLHVHAKMRTNQLAWPSQVHALTTRPACMFLNLRHLTYEIVIFTKLPNNYSGILQLAQYLAFAPQLEMLELHMLYHVSVGRCWRGEGVSYHMGRHDHLKTVYMSGFRCYRAQVDLLCGILDTSPVLEHVTIEPMTWMVAATPPTSGHALPRDVAWGPPTAAPAGERESGEKRSCASTACSAVLPLAGTAP
nr:unnamed protein product [Digitaria exilis]